MVIKSRLKAAKVARVASLSGLKTRSFPAYRIITMNLKYVPTQ